MSIFHCYCLECNKITPHKIIADEPAAARFFFGLCTLGLSEGFVYKYNTCLSCGNKIIVK